MKYKSFFPNIFVKDDTAYSDYKCSIKICNGDICKAAQTFESNGADGLIYFDISEDDLSHEKNIGHLRTLTRSIDIPVMAGGNIKRFEDVKKYLYAGAFAVLISNTAIDSRSKKNILTDAIERFGASKVAVRKEDDYFSGDILLQYENFEGILHDIKDIEDIADITDILLEKKFCGVTGELISREDFDFYKIKRRCEEKGINVNTLKSSISFEELKKDENGLVPVIVQDYKSDEVLMMAYMNEEAFEKTQETGLMTYYSRSRKELWVKGETSGHFQNVKAMSVDCDKDTLLAKVKQTGAACHTGNRTCFYTEIFSSDYDETNPLKVFSDVMSVIEDRKEHPREGSYTSYLFEQGIDKVLKKCGEESAEVIIAAKNPDPEEIKYEIADYLYHVMVLMSMKGVTWDDIIKELANR